MNRTLAAPIPDELTLLDNWVVWQYETRDGKTTKVPYDAKTGQRAKSNDPATWSSFTRAFAAADPLIGSGYDGNGFMLHGTDLVGLDFDGVVHDGVPEPFVLEILKHLGNPYCESTPSGNGLRAFVRCAALPPGVVNSRGTRMMPTNMVRRFTAAQRPKADDISR